MGQTSIRVASSHAMAATQRLSGSATNDCLPLISGVSVQLTRGPNHSENLQLHPNFLDQQRLCCKKAKNYQTDVLFMRNRFAFVCLFACSLTACDDSSESSTAQDVSPQDAAMSDARAPADDAALAADTAVNDASPIDSTPDASTNINDASTQCPMPNGNQPTR